MTSFVEISVNVPQVSGVFHYHLTEELEGKVQRGQLVTVPFGKQMVQGIVFGLIDTPEVPETRPVAQILDPDPVLTDAQIWLSKTIAEQTLAPISTCISLMLPPGLSQMSDTLYQLTPAGEGVVSGKMVAPKGISPLQNRVLKVLLSRGALRGRQLSSAFPRINWESAAQALNRKGLVMGEAILLPPSVHPKVIRTVQLAVTPAEAESKMDTLGKKGARAIKRRQAILRCLIRELKPMDTAWVYAESGGNNADLKKLAEMGLISFGESEIWRDPLAEIAYDPATPPVLTRAQEEVWQEIEASFRDINAGKQGTSFMLHGVTGSGKTEIYLRAVECALSIGKQALILVPEIALTPQTVRRFISRFPGQVGLVHSRLSQGERYDTWRRARSGLLPVIVGPRSALFSPMKDIGLIVVDESHDDSYYQSESPPFYHAREIALTYARQEKAVCILGSATPDIVSTHRASRSVLKAINLPDRILAHKETVRTHLEHLDIQASCYEPYEFDAETIDLPPVDIVDMRDELKQGNRSIFSRALKEELENVLKHQQQAILFLNRRGSATYVFCRDCGYTLKCPRCDTPLTFHLRGSSSAYRRSEHGKMICHRCGYERQLPKTCPQCSSTRIRHYGMGTERVETELHSLFPDARTLRWDWETTRKKDAHEAILHHFANHKADILIGTQMLAKGLDLPKVTLVGVVLADVGLNLPNYRASERTFQILTQVAGRAGRSPLGGRVILQTFHPDHYVIQTASRHDYREFYKQELEHRRNLGYPPFNQIVKLEFRDRNPQKVETEARKTAGVVQGWIKEDAKQRVDLIGPVPCFFSRVGGIYRWQLVLRGLDLVSFLQDRTLGDARVEVNPPSLL